MKDFSLIILCLLRPCARFLCCIRAPSRKSSSLKEEEVGDETFEEYPVKPIKKAPVLVYDDVDSNDSFDNAQSIGFTYGSDKRVGHRLSVVSPSSQGSKRSRKISTSSKLSYYSNSGEQAPQILLSVYVSRAKQYIAGHIFEINEIPGIENGGPEKVKVHVRILPSKKIVLDTGWTDVFNRKAFFVDEFKKSISKNADKKEKLLRFRVYGDKRCVGECCVDIEEIEGERGTQRFWMPLVQNENQLDASLQSSNTSFKEMDEFMLS